MQDKATMRDNLSFFFFFDPQKYLLTSTLLSFHHDFPMLAFKCDMS